MVQYAQIETKRCDVDNAFAQEFMVKRWGAEFTAALLAELPRFSRGPRKGKIKGNLFWTKCTKGGWVRTGPSYHGSPSGHVVTPGSRDLRVKLSHEGNTRDGYEVCPDNWPSSLTDEEKIERMKACVADMVRVSKAPSYGFGQSFR